MKTFFYRHKNAPLILLSLFCYLCLSACSSDPEDPEDQIRAIIEKIELAAEERKRSEVLEYISEQYLDDRQYTKESVGKLLQLYFIRNQSINIFTTIQSIEIHNNRAQVQLTAAIAAKGVDLAQEANRLKADVHRFAIIFKDESAKGDWKITAAQWQRGLSQ